MSDTSKTSTAPLIRLAHPLTFAALMRKVGAPVDRLFSRAGLPATCDDPSAFVPLRRAWAWFDAAAQLEDPALGWHVGRFAGDTGLSAGVLKKIEHAPTLYQALFALIRLVRAESTQLNIRIREDRDKILLYTSYPMKDWPGYASSQAYQLAVYIDVIRHYAGRQWMPSEIGVESPIAPGVIHEHYADSRIFPGQPFGYIAIPRSFLHYPPRGGTPGDVETSSPTPTERLDFVRTVKAVTQSYLGDGYPSAQKVASLLDTSERTLFRDLAGYGVAYQMLLDEVRFDLAKNMLREGDITLSDIAAHLGFSDPSNFSRMFRRIGGLTPRQFRNSITA